MVVGGLYHETNPVHVTTFVNILLWQCKLQLIDSSYSVTFLHTWFIDYKLCYRHDEFSWNTDQITLNTNQSMLKKQFTCMVWHFYLIPILWKIDSFSFKFSTEISSIESLSMVNISFGLNQCNKFGFIELKTQLHWTKY